MFGCKMLTFLPLLLMLHSAVISTVHFVEGCFPVIGRE